MEGKRKYERTAFQRKLAERTELLNETQGGRFHSSKKEEYIVLKEGVTNSHRGRFGGRGERVRV